MTVKDFKIWCIQNDYTQKSLAKRLKITNKTVSNYVVNGRFPEVFQLALQALTVDK